MTDANDRTERKCLYIPEMTWPEVKTALPQVKMAIIPVGSNEQHGPHGTFQFDTACAREFSLRLGARLYPRASSPRLSPSGLRTPYAFPPARLPSEPRRWYRSSWKLYHHWSNMA